MTLKNVSTALRRPCGWALACLTLYLAGCATSRGDDETIQADTLGTAVRVLGERGGDLALMKGLEDTRIDPDLLANAGSSKAADRLAKATQCAVQQGQHYAFLYTDRAPYDLLASVSLEGKLDPVYRDQQASIGLGAGTKLFTALAILGQGLNRTFIADNSLAETQCGEVALKDAPVESVLEAILKSARVLGFSVDSTNEYVFLTGPKPHAARSALLNPDGLDAPAQAFLDSRVDVFLPERSSTPTGVVITLGAETLRDAAETLSRQLGRPVTVERGLEELPVNPAVMRNVRAGTALDLLIRQWPVTTFGYEVQADRILIRRRTAAEPAQPGAASAPEQ